jgi:zinc protease
MAFNGTEHFEKQELVDYLEGIGMQFGPEINAYTSFDETVYMLQVPTDSAELVETAFLVLEDWAHGQIFDHEEIDKERGVIIEEWRLGQGAMMRMQEKQLPILFKDSRYAERLPIGKPEILESFEYQTLIDFYTDWYRPDLMAVIAVGDFDAAVIEELIKQHFSGLEMADNPRERTVFAVPDHEETLYAIASDPEAPNNTVSIYWKQPAREASDVSSYRQSLVESLFSQMLNTRLMEKTREADPPFMFAFTGQGRFIGSSEVYLMVAAVPENGIERGLEALLIEGARVAQHGFTGTELARAKSEMLRSMEQAHAEREKTNSSAYAAEYLRAYLYDEPIPGIDYEFGLYQRFVPGIELEEVNRLASEWIVDGNRVVMVNGPEKEGVKIPTDDELGVVMAAAAAAEVDAYEDAVADAPLVAVMPVAGSVRMTREMPEVGITRWALSNGVDVLLKPTDFKDDEILMRAYSPGGTSLASDEDYLAAATASAIVGQSGAGEFNFVDLQKALAGKAVSVSPFIGGLSEGFSGSASPQDVETLFQLVYLFFTQPRRDEEAFQSWKTRMAGFLANRQADPNTAFFDTITVTMSQGHPRARPPSAGRYETETNLDISYDFFTDRFADASDFTFMFVGNFDPDELKPLVETYLASLPSTRRDEAWRDVGITPPTGVIEKTVYRGIEPKAQTRIVFTGPFEWNRTNRHHLASLASVMRIQLREVLREDMGGTYGVGVSGASSKNPREEYSYTISFGTSPDRLEEMVDSVFAVIERLKTDGPSQEDIDKVKEQQRRSNETNLRNNGYWIGQMNARVASGGDMRDIPTYLEYIDALTAEDVREAARLYLNVENYVRVSLYPEEQAEGGGE